MLREVWGGGKHSVAVPEPSAGTAFSAGGRKMLWKGQCWQRSHLRFSSWPLLRESGQGPNYFADHGWQGKTTRSGESSGFHYRTPCYCRRKVTPRRSCEQAHPSPPSAWGCPMVGREQGEPRLPQGRPQKTIPLFPGLPAPGPIVPPGAWLLLGLSHLTPGLQCFSSSPFHLLPAALLSVTPGHL